MRPALQAILIAPEEEMRSAILAGRKTITIREGHRNYQPGPVMLCCHEEPWCVQADIKSVSWALLSEVTPEEMAADGFDSLEYMLERMRRFYPDLTPDSFVTIIRWGNVRGSLVGGT